MAWSGNPEVASDAVAEAFAQVLRRGDVVEDVGRWVWRAAFRIASGTLSQRRVGPLEHDVAAERSDAAVVAALAIALAQLGEDDRTVVVLCLVGGWPASDVAEFTGTTAGAVRVRLHRARARLRDLLEVDDA
jgi:RNA polymerase sigma-70 factor (ECF subfamily)